MEYRTLGKTGLEVSVLGFGCGNVAGLMVRGTPAERARAVARAVELGMNYFDTAPSYGDGLSERHLGEALRAARADVHVGTKFTLEPAELADAGPAITRSLEASLGRLGMDRVDLLQLHNPVGAVPTAAQVLDAVAPALERLRGQGKLRFWGITALGETAALHRLLEAGELDTAQVCLNLLNPTAAFPVPAGFPGQDFGRLLERAGRGRVGAIVIRVLAAGALSGAAVRHPVALSDVVPIATGHDYATDVRRARAFELLVREGHAESLVEAALRFPLASDAVSTVLLGCSSLDHLERAAAAMAKGPLPPAALGRLARVWRDLASEAC